MNFNRRRVQGEHKVNEAGPMSISRFRPFCILACSLGPGIAGAGPTLETATGGTFNYFGHLNYAFVSVDDGTTTNDYLANHASSTSRLGFNIGEAIGDTAFRFQFETALGLPSTSGFSNDPAVADPNWSWDQTDLRKIDFSLSGDWGTIYAGQGNMASDGVSEQDLSGTGLGLYVSTADATGSNEFRLSGGGLSGVEIVDAFKQFDGNGRKGRVRYDSPSFAGFKVMASYGEEILRRGVDGTFSDIAIAYENTFAGGTRVAGKIAYFHEDRSRRNTDGVSGSASVLLPSGLNVTVAAGDKDGSGSFYYGKLGYRGDFWDFGSTAVAIDYFKSDDQGLTGGATSSSGEAWGVGIVQKIDKINTEAVVAYRNYSFDDNLRSYQDISSILVGARWKF